MWSALQYVGTGLSFVAFVIAAIVLAYRTRLTRRVEIIRSAPEKERVDAIATTAEFFRVDVSKLPPAQQQEIVISQIQARSRRDLLAAIILFTSAVLIGCIALVSVFEAKYNSTNTSVAHRFPANYNACIGDQPTCQNVHDSVAYTFNCATFQTYPVDTVKAVASTICDNFQHVDQFATGEGGQCGYMLIRVTCP